MSLILSSSVAPGGYMDRWNQIGRKSREDLLKRPEIPKNPAPVGRKIISDRQRRIMAGLPLAETSDSEAEKDEREVKRAKVDESSVDSIKEPANAVKEDEETTVQEDSDASKTLSSENSDESLFGKWDKNKARKQMNEKIRRTEELLGGEFNIFKDKAPPLQLPKNRPSGSRPSGSSSDDDAKMDVVDNNNSMEQRAEAFHDAFVNRRERNSDENMEDNGQLMGNEEILNRTPAGGSQPNGTTSPEKSHLIQTRRSTFHVYDSLSSDEMVTPNRFFSTPKNAKTDTLPKLDFSPIPRSSFAKSSVIPSFSVGPDTPRLPRDPSHFAKPTLASERKATFKEPPRAPRGSRKTASNEERSTLTDESVERNEDKRRRVSFQLYSDSQESEEKIDMQPLDNNNSDDSSNGGDKHQKSSDSSVSDSRDLINQEKEISDNDSGSEVSERKTTSDLDDSLSDEKKKEADEDDGYRWHPGLDLAVYGNSLSPVRLSPRQKGDDEEEMEDEDEEDEEEVVEEDEEKEDEVENDSEREKSLEDSVPIILPPRRRGRTVVDPVDADDVTEDEEEESDTRLTRRRRSPVDRFDPDAVLQEGQKYVVRPRNITRSEPEPGLRRSTRNRMPTTRPWFGEHPVYELTSGGDRVLKGVTRAIVKEKLLIRAGTVNHKK